MGSAFGQAVRGRPLVRSLTLDQGIASWPVDTVPGGGGVLGPRKSLCTWKKFLIVAEWVRQNRTSPPSPNITKQSSALDP